MAIASLSTQSILNWQCAWSNQETSRELDEEQALFESAQTDGMAL